MSRSAETASSRADDIEKVMTEAVIDPETYGRIMGAARGATYRALAAGVPIKPIRFGKTYRIPTAPIRELLHLGPPPAAAA